MFVAALVCDLLLPAEVGSLKGKRSVVRPLIADLRRLEVAVGETGHQDLHRRAEVSVAVVSATAGRCEEVLDAAERLVASRPEVQLLAAHRLLRSDSDD
ncbi:DUF503 domain-containing protein [Pseudokineococcus basanitobsidens]|uniref:DUF503 domain-containing protein n=1 Tax=Pseudokineococcus basanitobsidens TaxID=1926649 RepID=A0ABU8RK07_9ACTN